MYANAHTVCTINVIIVIILKIFAHTKSCTHWKVTNEIISVNKICLVTKVKSSAELC